MKQEKRTNPSLTTEERNSWTKAYRFFEQWNHVQTEEDWLGMARAFGEMPAEDQKDELLQRLLCCCLEYWNDRQLKKEQEGKTEKTEQTVMKDGNGRQVIFFEP